MKLFKLPTLEIEKSKHGKIVDFLDGIRADHREGKYTEEKVRGAVDEFVMLYCERKGYCTYMFSGDKFIRILTPEGWKILEDMNYDTYLLRKAISNWRTWLPIFISLLAIILSSYVGWFKPTRDSFKAEGEPKIERLTTKLEQQGNLIDSLNHVLTKQQNPTIFYVDTSGIRHK